MSYVYLISSEKSNKVYVGKANNVEKRFNTHQNNAYRGEARPIYSWWRKYIGYIDIDILEVTESEEEAYEAEIFWIKYYKSIGVELLNVNEGGRGNAGYRHTDNTKRLLSYKSSGRIMRGRRDYNISPSHQDKMQEGCRKSEKSRLNNIKQGKLQGKKNCKSYKIINTVTNEEFIVHDLSQWCLDNGINKNSIRAQLHQRAKKTGIRLHRGFKIEYLEENNESTTY